MIFPGYLKHLFSNSPFRLSWVFVFLNVILHIVFWAAFSDWPATSLQKELLEEKTQKSVVEMYLQSLDSVARRAIVQKGDSEIFTLAIRDRIFWEQLKKFPFVGNQVEIENVKRIMSKFISDYYQSVHYKFGLSSIEQSPWAWVTYQFVHTNWIHLFGNTLVIFILVGYLEQFVTMGLLAFVYLFSGFAGGVFYLWLNSHSAVSVVGASAAASGLMAFLVIVRGQYQMPWFYIIAPTQKGMGVIYLPVFFILPIFLMNDFIELLSVKTGVSANVAISAHVGGALFGFFVGGLYQFVRHFQQKIQNDLLLRGEASSHGVLGDDDWFNELP